jgi:hypothetical protein
MKAIKHFKISKNTKKGIRTNAIPNKILYYKYLLILDVDDKIFLEIKVIKKLFKSSSAYI